MEKRFSWCKEQISVKETFDNVIFTDECSVQLDNHGRLCFRKKTEPKKLKPRPKHPIKVHVWGGISHKGSTSIVIFTGTLTAIRYCTILDQSLKPFIEKIFPDRIIDSNKITILNTVVIIQKITFLKIISTGGEHLQRALI